MTETPSEFSFPVVAVVRSCFRAKFGIPRQPGLIQEARGEIRLLEPYNQPNTVRGLEEFSHLWVLFVFHQSLREKWKATVRPPRLGGDKRIGVFASRSPFRPSPIGLSVLKLERVIIAPRGSIRLQVSGLDLLDGTPVLDIKPYLPYTDAIPQAAGGFAPAAPPENALAVTYSPCAEAQRQQLLAAGQEEFLRLIEKVLAADPRPAYQHEPGRVYSVFINGYEVFWQIGDHTASAEILEFRRNRPT